MPSVRTVLSVLAVPVLLAGVLVWKLPHLRLGLEIAQGEFDAGPSVPMRDAVLERPPSDWLAVPIGALTLRVPPHMVPVSRVNPLVQTYLEAPGLTVCVFSPRPVRDPMPTDYLDMEALPRTVAADPLELRLAAYATSPGDFSIRMNAAEVRRLNEVLVARSLVCHRCDAVEVLRGPGFKGLLLTTTHEDAVQMVVEYFSDDGVRSGSAYIRARRTAADSLETARRIIGSFELGPGDPAASTELALADPPVIP